MTVLAKRAIACSGWRWMPGMLTLDGLRLGVVAHTPSGAWSCLTAGGEPSDRPMRDELPDLSDPATMGCLLHLTRQAWCCNVVVVVKSPGRRFVVLAREWSGVPSETGEQALVEALEDAPCEI